MCNLQYAICNVQYLYAMCNVQYAICNMQYATCAALHREPSGSSHACSSARRTEPGLTGVRFVNEGGLTLGLLPAPGVPGVSSRYRLPSCGQQHTGQHTPHRAQERSKGEGIAHHAAYLSLRDAGSDRLLACMIRVAVSADSSAVATACMGGEGGFVHV